MVYPNTSYGFNNPFNNIFPSPVISNREPTTSDSDYSFGQLWINQSTDTIYSLVNISSSGADWQSLGGGSSEVIMITGNAGDVITPDSSGNVNILGSSQYIFTGNSSTNSLTLSDDGTVATTFTSDSGNAVPSSNILTITGSGGITTSGSGSTLTIVGSGESLIDITSLVGSGNTYIVLTSDYYLSCDVSGGTIQLNLPNSPTTGKVWVAKDSGGDASTNNITVTTPGGVVLIDGSTTFVMNTDYESAQFVFNGTSYEVF
jgi:hypothetical protein